MQLVVNRTPRVIADSDSRRVDRLAARIAEVERLRDALHHARLLLADELAQQARGIANESLRAKG